MGGIFLVGIKFIFSLLFLPVVFSCAISLREHLSYYPIDYENSFFLGGMASLLIFLFVHQFWGVYEFGQKMVSSVFKFLAPLERPVANFLPFYFICITGLFSITKYFLKINNYDNLFLFCAGFAFVMHVLFVSQDLQEREKSLIKPNYLFFMTLIFIFNVFLLVLFLNLAAGKFTFPVFFKSMIMEARYMYIVFFRKILMLG